MSHFNNELLLCQILQLSYVPYKDLSSCFLHQFQLFLAQIAAAHFVGFYFTIPDLNAKHHFKFINAEMVGNLIYSIKATSKLILDLLLGWSG